MAENNIINIAYILRKEDIFNTVVSLYSLFQNTKHMVNLYFFHDQLVETKNIRDYLNEIQQNKMCHDIKFIEIDYKKYKHMKYKFNFHERFYIVEIPELIQENKIIFISNNTLVTSDLEELYNIDISNNSCAAVEMPTSKTILERNELKRKACFNNAVMLINLECWRERHYFEKSISSDFIKNLTMSEKLYEEDLFNILIDDCKYIDLKYNFLEIPTRNEFSIKMREDYRKCSVHVIIPQIISFALYTENCIPIKCSYSSLWWKYAKQTPIYKEIKNFRQLNKYKLSATSAENSFNYFWLLARIWPYIKPYWFRILLGFAITIPLGLLDGVTAFALKPYMDYVVGAKDLAINWHGINLSITSMQMAYILPIGVVLFAALQGLLCI